jgi:hypothetical protein
VAVNAGRLLTSSSIEIFVFRADDYRVLKINDGARRNLGYSDEDLMTLTLPDLNRAMSGHRLDAETTEGVKFRFTLPISS